MRSANLTTTRLFGVFVYWLALIERQAPHRHRPVLRRMGLDLTVGECVVLIERLTHAVLDASMALPDQRQVRS